MAGQKRHVLVETRFWGKRGAFLQLRWLSVVLCCRAFFSSYKRQGEETTTTIVSFAYWLVITPKEKKKLNGLKQQNRTHTHTTKAV